MRDISKYQSKQALTAWAGDVSSLLTEMKRRAGVRTDQELARFMGAAQSTVSNWRKRDAVPESAILQFEHALEDPGSSRFQRSLAARAVAMRLPEIWYDRFRDSKPTPGRFVPYSVIASNLNAIVEEIARQMETLENRHRIATSALAALLIEDNNFLNGVIDWVGSTPMDEMLRRELMATRNASRP